MRVIRGIIFIGLISFTGPLSFGQDQKIADSIITAYENGQFENEFETLSKITRYETNPSIIIEYSDILINKASKDSIGEYLVYGHLQKGNALKQKGDYYEAINSYFKTIDLSKKLMPREPVARYYISVADTYANLKDYEEAEKYYTQYIPLLDEDEDKRGLAIALLNSGENSFYLGNYELALQRLERAEQLFPQLDADLAYIGHAYSSGNKGMIYTKQQRYSEAKELLTEALKVVEDLGDNYAISAYLLYLSDIAATENELDSAFNLANRSLKLASEDGLKNEMSNALYKLHELHNSVGNSDSAMFYFKNHIALRDSLINAQTTNKIASLTTNFQLSQKDLEVAKAEERQRLILIGSAIALVLIGLIAFGLFRRNRFIRRTNIVLERERNRSDHLLKNILPAETAKELKDHGRVKAKRFDSVSVMFTDFEGFTLHAEHLSPEDLVTSVDFYFSQFDKIVEKYNIEKIKTVGDAYMCAAGLPFPQEDHAEKMVLAAKEMIEFVNQSKKINDNNQTRFDIRIGISSGPVVAGVVGHKKFAYDIWGDTVNCAARMEHYSKIGRINVSEDTYKLVKDKFQFINRGEIEVKNKGNMTMYFVQDTPAKNHLDSITVSESETVT